MKKVFFAVLFCVVFAANNLYSQSLSVENGKTLYAIYCQSCHKENGEGVQGEFPPLAQAQNLKGTKKQAQIILRGMRGETIVKGVTYNAEMAGIELNDQEVADVINYIRNAWGNKAPLIRERHVAKAKKAVVKGYTPY